MPHHRRRVFIVASLHGDPRDVILSHHNRCDGLCKKSGSRECYTCFSTNPQCSEPTQVAACVDFLQKRRPPVLHEIDTITSRNIRRICIVREHVTKAAMLSVSDAERLFGFPQGWTEPCTQLNASESLVSEEPCKKTHQVSGDESLPRDNRSKDEVDKGRVGLNSRPSAIFSSNQRVNVENVGKSGRNLEKDLHSIEPEEQHYRAPAKIEACAGALGTHGDICGGIEPPSRSAKDTSVDPIASPRKITSETEYSGNESDNDDMILTASEAAFIVRILLVASASAVPHARWIGQRLINPYALKFQCQQLGTPFCKEIPGGLDDPEGRAWPEAAWNMHPHGSHSQQQNDRTDWKGRHALRDWSDMPLRLPFVPLGDFLHQEGAIPSVHVTTSYITALQIANADIPYFVMQALDPDGETATQDITNHTEDKPHCDDLIRLEDLADLASAEPSLVTQSGHKLIARQLTSRNEDGGSNHGASGSGSVDDIMHNMGFLESKRNITEVQEQDEPVQRESRELLLSGDEDENNIDDPLMSGRPVWAPWRLGKGVEQVLWPGISLHREKNKNIIPDTALKIKVKGATADSHQLVVFFGDRTYQWLPASSLFTFRDQNFEDRMAQNVKRHTASFQRACQEARIWSRTWQKLKFQDGLQQGRSVQHDLAEVSASTITAAAKHHAIPYQGIKKSGCQSSGTLKATWYPRPMPMPPSQLLKTRAIPYRERSGIFGVNNFGPTGYTGSLASAAEPEPCGVCQTCQSRVQVLDRRTDAPSNRALLRHLKCPQVSAVRVARTGHAGALLALRREGAVGQRIKIMIGNNNQFCSGRVCVFYVDFYSHDVELDSGEYFAGIRLWNESVQVIDPETSPRPTRHISSIKDCKQNFIAADLLKRRFRGKKEARESTLNAKRKAIEIQHDALSNVQRCESCSRSHKSIAYCVSRGHSTGLAGIDADVRNETVRGVDAKTEFVPRTAARRGGNGKFVVSESVGTALATAGVEIPERCALCIRRKKGLAHCLKKGHVAGTETAAAIILPATELLKTRSTFAPRASAAGSAPLALDSDRPTDTTSHDPNLFVCRLSKTVRVARDDSAQTQAVAAAAMADAFAKAAANAPLPCAP